MLCLLHKPETLQQLGKELVKPEPPAVTVKPVTALLATVAVAAGPPPPKNETVGAPVQAPAFQPVKPVTVFVASPETVAVADGVVEQGPPENTTVGTLV